MTPKWLPGRSIRAGVAFLTLIIGAGSIAYAQNPPIVLYVPNFNTSTMSEFLVSPSSGALSTMPVKPTNRNAFEIAVAPNRRFMYVGENGAIDLFVISPDGTATVAPSATITGNVSGIGVDPSGMYLYAVNSSQQRLETYSINQSNGQITLLGTPIAFPNTYLLRGMVIDKNNNLYVAVVNNGAGSGWIAAYKIGAGGALTANGTYGAGTGTGLGPSRLIVNPAGTMLFASDNFDAAVSQFTISGSGSLTLIGPPLSTGVGTQPLGLSISPNGNFLLVTNNSAAGGVFVYSIGAGASLALVGGSPFSAGSQSVGVTVDPNGVNVFVSNFADSTVTRFLMNSSTGVLSAPVTTSLGSATGPEYLLSGFLPAAATTVPTLSMWGLLLLGMLLAASGVLMYRRAYR